MLEVVLSDEVKKLQRTPVLLSRLRCSSLLYIRNLISIKLNLRTLDHPQAPSRSEMYHNKSM